VFMVVLGARLDWRLAAGGVVMAMLAIVFLKNPRLIRTGIFLMAAFTIAMLCARTLFDANPAPWIARQLEPFAGQPIAALGMPPVINSQVRLVSGGRINPQETIEIPANGVLLVGESRREEVSSAGYELKFAGFRIKRMHGSDAWRAWRSGKREDMFERNRQNFYIATRPQ